MNKSPRNTQAHTEELETLKRRIRELEQAEAQWQEVEEALNRGEETFRNLIEHAPDAIYVHAEASFLFLNSVAATLFGAASADQLIGSPLMDRFHPSCHEMIRKRLHLLYEENRSLPIVEQTYIRLDGSSVPVEAHAVPIIYDHQKAFLTFARDISQRKRSEEALRESEERYRELVDNASDIVFKTDDTGHFTFVNQAVVRIVGYKKEEILGKNYTVFVRPDMREDAVKFFGLQFAKGLQNTYSEYPVIAKDGSEVWLGQNTKLIVQDGRVAGFQAMARDITARKLVEEELHRNRCVAERLAKEIAIIAEIGKVIGSSLDIEEVYERFAAETQKLILFDSLTINLFNSKENALHVAYVSGLDIDGRRQGDPLALEGSLSEAVIHAGSIIRIQPASIDEIVGKFPRLVPIFRAGLRSIMCVPLIYRDEVIGVLHFRSKQPNAYTEEDLRLAERIGEQIVGTIANAQLYAGLKKTEQELKESEQRYRELSIVDDLTKLHNSRQFYVQLKIELDRANRYEQPLTLLLLDLDDFKAFNDAYGHVEGDHVLWRLGQVIKRCLRETDFAYRYGGEEFTILLPMTTSADGAVTADRIRTEFKKEHFSPVPGREVHMTVCIGLAQYHMKEEMKAFVHRADQWMYQGKKKGKDRVCCES